MSASVDQHGSGEIDRQGAVFTSTNPELVWVYALDIHEEFRDGSQLRASLVEGESKSNSFLQLVRTLFHSQSFAKDAIMTIATASSFYVEQVRNVTVLCFTVRVLNEQNYDVVSEELLEFVSLVVSERPIQVVVELSSISDIDDMGLAMLQAFQDSIDDADGTLVLCRAPANVLAKIRQAALGCHCCRTRGEAVWSF